MCSLHTDVTAMFSYQVVIVRQNFEVFSSSSSVNYSIACLVNESIWTEIIGVLSKATLPISSSPRPATWMMEHVESFDKIVQLSVLLWVRYFRGDYVIFVGYVFNYTILQELKVVIMRTAPRLLPQLSSNFSACIPKIGFWAVHYILHKLTSDLVVHTGGNVWVIKQSSFISSWNKQCFTAILNVKPETA